MSILDGFDWSVFEDIPWLDSEFYKCVTVDNIETDIYYDFECLVEEAAGSGLENLIHERPVYHHDDPHPLLQELTKSAYEKLREDYIEDQRLSEREKYAAAATIDGRDDQTMWDEINQDNHEKSEYFRKYEERKQGEQG